MKLGMSKKVKKIVIISASCCLAAALTVTGILAAVHSKAANTTVDVEQVAMVSTMYWGDQSSTYGTATSDFVQELYPDTTKAISEIFVEEGQEVKIGDTLLQYDTTKLKLTVEGKELEVKKKEYELEKAQDDLNALYNTAPYVEPTPPPPTPTPTPIPESKAELYAELTEHSKPFAGTGTEKDPYVFLCTEDCVLTKGFLLKLFGLESLKPTPSPTPTATPSAVPSAEPSTAPSAEPSTEPTPMPEPTAEPTPTASPTAEPTAAPTEVPVTEEPAPETMSWFQKLLAGEEDKEEPEFELPNGPFNARFEVHTDDNENLPLVKGWTMDGEKITAGFWNGVIDKPEGDIEIQQLGFGIEPMSYMDGMYTSEQLSDMIKQKKQEIKDLELAVKQAKVDLNKAQLEFKNATVTSTVNGTIKTLTDLDSALASGSPFMVVSGGDGFYVTGTLNESLLGRIQVGDTISVSSWEIGSTYTAEIVRISDFPLDSNNYNDGSTNPNSSNYAFTAFIAEAEGLKNGMWLDIILQAGAEPGMQEESTFYVSKAYIRSDEKGRYVLKVGEDKRVHKEYIETGKTVYNEYLEIKSDNLTQEDYVAFPYGASAIEGAKANLPEGAELGDKEAMLK